MKRYGLPHLIDLGGVETVGGEKFSGTICSVDFEANHTDGNSSDAGKAVIFTPPNSRPHVAAQAAAVAPKRSRGSTLVFARRLRRKVASTKVVYEPVRSGVSLPND